MALLDPIVSPDEYRDRVGNTDEGTDGALEEQLISGTRLAERSLRLAPGTWMPATGTRRFDGSGKAKLWLADELGQHYLRTISEDGITVDSNNDGQVDYTFDLDEDWIDALPRNSALFSEPFDSLELRRYGFPPLWPQGRGNVSITGSWGFATAPNEVAELVIHLVQEVRQGHLAGISLSAPSLDMIGPQHTDLWRRWLAIKNLYGMKRLRVA